MKKTLLTALALGCVSSLMMAGSAFAIPQTAALQDAFNARTEGGSSSVDVYTEMLDDTSDSTWEITASSQSAATLLFEFAGYAENNSFGIYDLGTNTTLELFSGPDAAGSPSSGATVTLEMFTDSAGIHFTADNWNTQKDFTSTSFGYYLNVGDTSEMYYSDSARNTTDNGYDHMFAYQGKGDEFSVFNNDTYATWTDNEYILAWEDLNGVSSNCDNDYTDFVVMVESVQPVPEPATMLLFGTGLAGLIGVSRRRRKQA